MQGTFIKPEDILRASNGGLDIIIDLYPDAFKSVEQHSRKFKLRSDEKTASASLKRVMDSEKGMDVYLVTDFGGDSKTRNGILCYAKENNIEYVDALRLLAAKYGVAGEDYTPEVFKATFSKRAATDEEPEGLWTFEIRQSFEDFEIETLFSKHSLNFVGWNKGEEKRKAAYSRIAAVCLKYRFWPLVSYTIIKNREALIFSSNDTYPMFIIDEKYGDKDEKSFKKIYQPRHEDKGRRFMYNGEKPKDFIHGLIQAKREFKKREDDVLNDDQDYDSADDETKKEKRKAEKLEEFILVSGGSDALNAALLGYWVGWMNSETAQLQPWDFTEMSRFAKKVYQLQDIDDTGKRMAHEIALKYLDLYTIELPDDLKQKKDTRGNPCKDLRDYLNHYDNWAFKELVKDALPYRFWEMQPEYTGRGEGKTRVGWKYDFDNVQAYNFLNKNGFFRMAVEGRKTEYIFIHVDGNIVREVTGNRVKNYMHNFLRERRMDKDLRNTLYKSTQLNESSLSNLSETTIDFTDFDDKSQFMFFNNSTWEVTAAGIQEHKPGRVKRYVWEHDVIEHNTKVTAEPFTIKKFPDGNGWDIEINKKDSVFLNLLIQTSRSHWRRELEEALPGLNDQERALYLKENKFSIAGPLLTKEEADEQKLHLVNKIFTLGYLLHRHKDRSRAWAHVGMDGKFSEDGKSNGGSGKSLVFNQAINHCLKKVFVIPGTNPRKTDDPHIFHGLSEHHRETIVDDADRYLNFRFFFEYITTGQSVNPKNGVPFFIPFEKLAKLSWLTNFNMTIDPSTARRIIYTVFFDYYHIKGDESDYKETREPKDEFGKNLFSQFTPDEWNDFFNVMARCLQFFLSTTEKILPPMENVDKRNLQAEMGENFENWAAVYFSEQSGNLDRLIVKEEAFIEFEEMHKSSKWSPQRFSRALKAFCKFHHYGYNPEELVNTKDKKRIIHQVQERKRNRDGTWTALNNKKSYELIYIRTDFEKAPNSTLPGESVLPF